MTTVKEATVKEAMAVEARAAARAVAEAWEAARAPAEGRARRRKGKWRRQLAVATSVVVRAEEAGTWRR